MLRNLILKRINFASVSASWLSATARRPERLLKFNSAPKTITYNTRNFC